jgi:hypothetical protein
MALALPPTAKAASFPDDTEVGAFETLSVNFSSGQFVHSISLRLLFGGRDEQEQGIYSINGGAFVPFFANSDSGDLTLVIDQPEVNQIQFQAPRFVDDYALNSVDLTAVPEPASMILLGTGLLLAARRRYQMKRQQ